MNGSEYLDCLFYSFRVTGRSLSSLPDVENILFETLRRFPEKTIPKNSKLWGSYNLDFNYPILLSFHKGTNPYILKQEINVFVIDESEVLDKLSRFFEKRYGFKHFERFHLYILLKEYRINGYISGDKLLFTFPKGLF